MSETTNEKLDKQNALLERLVRRITPEDSEETEYSKICAMLDDHGKKLNELSALLNKNSGRVALNSLQERRVDEEPTTDPKFSRRMYLAVAIALLLSAVSSVATFKHITPAFPFALGLFVVFMGVSIWLYLDEFIFIGNTLGRMAKNAVSIGLAVIAISILYFTGVTIGNSYLSNSYGSSNENTPKAENTTSGNSGHYDGNGQGNSNAGQQQHSPARSGNTEASGRSGEPEREQ